MAISRADPQGTDFPNLEHEAWRETSPQDAAYNCIAWAVGNRDHWWWPADPPFAYCPGRVDDEPTVRAFVRMFMSVGFERVDSGLLEEGFDRIALYANEQNEVLHAARQLPNGKWTSKLGRNIDIEHTLRGLEGPCYGNVVCFLRRHVQ